MLLVELIYIAVVPAILVAHGCKIVIEAGIEVGKAVVEVVS